MDWLRRMWNGQFDQYSSDDNSSWEIQIARLLALGTGGFWPGRGKNHRIGFFILLTIIIVICNLRQLIIIFLFSYDIMEGFIHMAAISQRILFIISIISLRFNSKIRQSLLEEMRQNWKSSSYGEDGKVMHRYAGWSRKIALIFAVASGSIPTFDKFRSLVKVVMRGGDFGSCYPFWPSNEFVVASCHASELITTYMFFVMEVGIDVCFTVFILHTAGQLIILGNRIKTYEGQVRHSSDEEILSKCSCLKCIVDSHVKICDFVKEINEYLHMAIFTKIWSSVISFCFAVFNVSWLIKNRVYSGQMMINVLNPLMNIATVFLYCCLAEMSQRRSYALGDIAYSTKWMTKDPKISRNLMFIIRHSRIPLKITGLKFFVLSLSFFKEMVLLGWSYFLVMKNVLK